MASVCVSPWMIAMQASFNSYSDFKARHPTMFSVTDVNVLNNCFSLALSYIAFQFKLQIKSLAHS